jgi:succinoglycan biosynthesis protein ExoA
VAKPNTSPTDADDQSVVDAYFETASSYWNDIYRRDDVTSLIVQRRAEIALSWVEQLGLPLESSVLEVGCGAGLMSAELARRGFRVCATDAAIAMVDLARTQASEAGVSDLVDVRKSDVHALDFEDATFDLVIALGVIPWLLSPSDALHEIGRVLKPGRVLIASVNNEARLQYLFDPLRTPHLREVRSAVKKMPGRRGHSGSRSRGPHFKLHSCEEFERLLTSASLNKEEGRTFGFGPFTFFGRRILPERVGVALHHRLQRLADRGFVGIASRGAQYMVVARKTETVTRPQPSRAEAESPLKPVRRVSIVVPMLNEAAHVESLVADIAAQDFAGEIEVVVADGGSTDDSTGRLRAAAARQDVSVELIVNSSGWVSHGLNACLEHAKGDLIVRLDCHTRYPADYVRKLAVAAEETGAWCVGGVATPVGRKPTERAAACATASPFGGVHWTRQGGRGDRVEVDTVYCGAFRPETFDMAGTFDESLRRNQDDELSLRMRRAGGQVVLDPSIHAYYRPRDSYRAAFSQYYEYGFWKIAVMKKHRRVVSGRSLVPLAFVGSVAVLGLASASQPAARRLLGAELALYGVSAIGFGAASIGKRREPLRLLPRVVAFFLTYHVAYGVGLLGGIFTG